MYQSPMTIEDILLQIERGNTTVATAEALRYLTAQLFECPECHRLTSNLYGRFQVCGNCYSTLQAKLAAEQEYE